MKPTATRGSHGEEGGLRLRSGRTTTPTEGMLRTHTWSAGTGVSVATGASCGTYRTGDNDLTLTEDDPQNVTVKENVPRNDVRPGTADSEQKRRELEARIRLMEIRRQEVEIEKQLALAEYELAVLPSQSDTFSINFDARRTAAVPPPRGGKRGFRPGQREIEDRPIERRGQGQDNVSELTSALANALKYLKDDTDNSGRPTPPKYLLDLPTFDGDISEWIAFKTVYEDTKHMFNEIQNVARLRKALKGTAREAIKSLLYSGSHTVEIMDSLERRFGRPEILIMNELETIKKMPRLHEDGRNIAPFANKVANCVAAIKALRKPHYLYLPELTSRIADKLNLILKFKWSEYTARYPDEPDLERMSEFLNEMSDQCGAMASMQLRREEKKEKQDSQFGRRRRPVHAAQMYESEEIDSDSDTSDREAVRTIAAVNKSTKKHKRSVNSEPKSCSPKLAKELICSLCNDTHSLKDCEKFRSLSYNDRWNKVKELKVCFRCLSTSHRRFNCRAKPCGKDGCRIGHHELLHPNEEPRTTIASTVNAIVGDHITYLKIIPVELHGPRGSKETFALLDEGSTMTLMEEDIALAIAPRGKAKPLSIEGVGGQRTDFKPSFRLSVKIRGRFQRKLEPMTAFTIGPLNLTTQAVSRELVARCAHLKDIEDQLTYERARPTILIGQDNWHLITTRAIKEGDIDQPVASYTSLGWMLHGREKERNRGRASVNHVVRERDSDSGSLDAIIKEHFSIESLGIEPKRPSSDINQRALHVLDGITRQLPCGRYETGLIWRTNDEIMPENKQHAERRLQTIEKKLKQNENMKSEYTKQIRNLLEKGYAEEAPFAPESPRTWYLPHFAVHHPQKGKMRLVFDAAARVGGRSLNDALLPGPDLLQSLFGVLARFREGNVAVIADIKEMFLQIRIREEDRDSLRFLWRESEKEPIKEYRMTSLIFGAASSPCTAIYVKNKNAESFKELYPETAAAIERQFYMDDYLQAFEDATTANKTVKEMQNIHEGAKFELRGWASNDPKALAGIQGTSESSNTATLGDKEERTLGLVWKINSDTLSFALNLRNTPIETIEGHRPPTKREVTSAVMSVFVPLGLASPITIQGKKLIQNIWRSGIDWDTEITKETELEWKKWLGDLNKLQDLEIPRSITPSPNRGEMHVFVDASEQAYACAVYWLDEKTKRVSLIAAKAKVTPLKPISTPLKPISIPRLELQAAVLGCRLATSIKRELNSETTATTYWSDSRTVLAWIKSDPRQFKPFVAHRLAEIEETTTQRQWRWVPTKLNVADDATREPPNEFSATHRWFTGPPFLQLPADEWPQEKAKDAIVDDLELKRAKVHTTTTATKSNHDPLPAVDRFSNWGRYVRATARVIQCTDILRRRYRHDETEKRGELYPMTTKYLQAAEHLIVQKAQREDFAEEIVRIKSHLQLPKASPLRKLCVELDEHGILRVTGRLDLFSNLDETKKRPAILNARNAATKMLIQHTHETFMHGNHDTVINELRQKYFILGLRNAVRKLIHNCQWCKLRKLQPTKPQEGALPPERMNNDAPPFNCSAIDYFGPMNVTIGRRTEKRWGALITCLTTRAIHIELAASLTPSSAIMALRRFMARRGTPSVIYSDNGTNFVRANKELKIAADEVKDYATARGIVWKFIPPGAPHMGGAWERMIRTVKTSLSAVLKERTPREETLHTLLLEVEHVVNSRPLTPVQPDLNKEG